MLNKPLPILVMTPNVPCQVNSEKLQMPCKTNKDSIVGLQKKATNIDIILSSPIGEVPSPTLIQSRRISQIRNKAHFFQGQVNPLFIQNLSNKQEIVYLQKRIAQTTALLRSLLPVNEKDVNKKLKLEMSELQQITDMIKDDWKAMEEEIRTDKIIIQKTKSELSKVKQEFNETVQNHRRQVFQKEAIYNLVSIILNMGIQQKDKEKNTEMQNNQKKIKEMQEHYDLQLQKADQQLHKARLLEADLRQQLRNQKGINEKLKLQLKKNMNQFEEAKNRLKQIFNEIMENKLKEQAESYQMMLKAKEDEKMELTLQIDRLNEEHHRQMELKNDSIRRLSEKAARLNEEIEKQQDELWKRQQLINDHLKRAKEVENWNKNSEESIKSLTLKLKMQDKTIEQMKTEFDQHKAKLQNQMANMKQKYEEQLRQQRSKISQVQKKLQETIQSLQITKRNLNAAEEVFEARLQQERKKYEQEVRQLKQDNRVITTVLEEAKKKLQEKDRQINCIRLKAENKYNDAIQEKELYYQAMMEKIKKQMEDIETHSTKHIMEIKESYEQRLLKLTLEKDDEIKKTIFACQLKIQERDNMYRSLEAELKKAKEQHLLEEERLKNQVVNIQKQLEERMQSALRQMAEKMERQEKNALNLLKEKEKELSELNATMLEQLMIFQKKMDQKESQYSSHLAKLEDTLETIKKEGGFQDLENKYKEQIDRLKEEYETRIIQIRQAHQLNLQQIDEAHKREIQSLQQGHKETIGHIVFEHTGEIERKMEEKAKELDEQAKQFEKDMVCLAEKLESDIQRISNELVNEKTEHRLSKMTRQEKIQYLSQRIQALRKDVEDKEIRNLELQNLLQDKRQELQKIMKEIDLRVQDRKQQLERQKLQLIAKCQAQLQEKDTKCKAEMNKVEAQRIRYTQIMYEQFNELKEAHYNALMKQKKKYIQLETLLDERPSRAEDLTKIKELISINQKMDLQIENCHKKVSSANDIVRYLGLQLENYKDIYDIFGPGIAKDDSQLREGTQKLRDVLRSKRSQTIAKTQAIQEMEKTPFKKYSKEEISLPHIGQEQEREENQRKEQKEPKQQKSRSIGRGRKVSIIKDKSEEVFNGAQNFLAMLNKNNFTRDIERHEQPYEPYGRNKKYKNRQYKNIGVEQSNIISHSKN